MTTARNGDAASLDDADKGLQLSVSESRNNFAAPYCLHELHKSSTTCGEHGSMHRKMLAAQ